MNKISSFTVLLTLLVLIRHVAAQPGAAPANTLDEHRAVAMAADASPSLRAALLDRQRADLQVAAEDDRYPLILQLDAGATHLRSPRLYSADPSDPTLGPAVVTSTSDDVLLGSELRKSFWWGTSMAARVEGSWNRSTSPPVPPFQYDALTLGPGYGLLARFSVLQPILRGAGRDAGEAELRAAEHDRTAAERTGDRVASELLRDALTAYWELWYATEALGIERAAREVAERERADTARRIVEGDQAPVSVHSFAMRVAELDESVLLAALERDRRAIELGVQVGVRGERAKRLETSRMAPPAPEPAAARKRLVERALRASPELRELEAQVQAARDRERIAGEPDRHRLDLEGWVQTEGLGNRRVPPALEQFHSFGAFSAHVGLVYELPLTGSRYASQQAAARKSTEAAEARRDAVRQRIEGEVLALADRLDVAARRLALAERTADLAKAEHTAAKERVALGDGVALEVVQAEDSMRRAELRKARARVDWVHAKILVDHLTGALLRSRAKDVKLRGAETGRALAPRRVASIARGPF